MSNDNGGKAFPCEISYGMTLRDYFAAKAINAILTQYDFSFFLDDKNEKDGNTFAFSIAKDAYALADAMLKAREQ